MTHFISPRSIPRITMPSQVVFESDFVRASRPVIIEGAMSHWPAMRKWSRAYFRTSAASTRVVPVEYYAQGNPYAFPAWDRRPMRDLPLGEYMDLLASPEARHYYLADEDIKTALPELWPDVVLPPLFERRLLAKTGLFVGRDTVDAAHCHPTDQVMVCQVVGTRRITLFEPDDGRWLSPLPWYSPNFNWSPVDFDQVPPDANPRLAARRYECHLSPGEMLFVPLHWWNLMQGEGFNAAVCLIWSAQIREWPLISSKYSVGRVAAAGLVNNAIVQPLLLPWLMKKFAREPAPPASG